MSGTTEQTILEIIKIVLSMFGGATIYHFYPKFVHKTKKKSTAIAKHKGKGNQSLQAVDSPGAKTNLNNAESQINTGDYTTINIPRAASEQEALTQQEPTLNQESIRISSNGRFILAQLNKIFESSGEKCPDSLSVDYGMAEKYQMSGEARNAATLYVRVFQPLVDVLKKVGEDITVQRFEVEIDKLVAWSDTGSYENGVDEIVKSIEKISYEYIRNAQL
ncbi:hypothetical protein KY385_04660 [Candidatus Parcubacteria bacterium]|nr:hypothetical protein [Candidatus Parcubacteria bacterium]